MYEGIVKTIIEGKGFGFIESPNQPDFFFHCSSLNGLDFDEVLIGRRVRFDMQSTPKGNRAIDVQAAD